MAKLIEDDINDYEHLIDEINHKTVKTVIYEAEIDEGILTLVNWLNSIHGIVTRFSCQGHEDVILPYVVIWVDTDYMNPMAQINDTIARDPHCKVEAESLEGRVHRYHISFTNVEEMERIRKKVEIMHNYNLMKAEESNND